MYQILTKNLGKLIEIEETDKIKSINTYKRGIYTFKLNKRPKCNICGSDLQFIKKGKYLIINKCLNDDCPTNHCEKKGNPIKWKAFLPDNVLEEQYNKRISHNSFNLDYLINVKGLSEEEAKEYINKQIKQRVLSGKKNKGANRKQQYINKYGEELGLKKMCEDNPLRIEHWLKQGYTEEESKEIISNIQKKNSSKVKNYNGISKEYYKSKGIEDVDLFMREKSIRCIEFYLKRGYTEEEGKKKINELQSRCSKQVKNHINNRQIQYWVNKGYTEEESKEIISNLQRTFSKKKCIEKYGEVEGLKIFNERQYKWQKTLHDNKSLKIGYSKISQELFDILLKNYNLSDYDNIFYATKNREYSINDNNKNYVYDFVDIKNMKIIEFQGDLYHANPKIYTNETYKNPYDHNKTAEMIWEHDLNKKMIAEKYGFEIYYVWESDYKNNKEISINKCKQFLGING